MPKYLWQVSYTAEGLKGVMKDGGTGRRAAVQHLTEELGGRVEVFYYTFGPDDAVVIAELPDHKAAAAVGLAVGAAGKAQIRTTVLLTPEEIDEAAKTSVDYRPPGG